MDARKELNYTIQDGRVLKIIRLVREAAETYDELPDETKGTLREYPYYGKGKPSLPSALLSALTAAMEINANWGLVGAFEKSRTKNKGGEEEEAPLF
jgi:hypothetical protein